MLSAHALVSALLQESEVIQACAVRLKDGTILTGETHTHIFSNAVSDGLFGEYAQEMDEDDPDWARMMKETGWENGFITNTGRFVGRKEAYRIARKATQVPANAGRVLWHSGMGESSELPPWTGEYTHKVNGYPAIVTKNSIPGELPWRATWFDEVDHGVIGHVDLPSSTTRCVEKRGTTYYIDPVGKVQESRERLVAAAVKLSDGTILLGPTHAYCWDDAMEDGNLDCYMTKPFEEHDHAADAWEDLDRDGLMGKSVDGFYTDRGRFLTREEACVVAMKSKQIDVPPPACHLDVDDMEGMDQEYGEVIK